MKIPAFAAIFLLASTALFAQNRGVVSSGVVSRPAAVSAARPAAATNAAPQQHGAGSVLYPAGAVPPVNGGLPFVNTSVGINRVGPGRDRPRASRSSGFAYSYPIFVGGSYYGGYDSSYGNQLAPSGGQDQPNVVVVYPPPAPPVIINQYGSGEGQPAPRVQPQNLYYPPAPEDNSASSSTDTTHYIIAFKDHSIYSAVAYWVDGDTLHYFTTPTTHNQASVSLVDRDLTKRLNEESGVEVKLPPAK